MTPPNLNYFLGYQGLWIADEAPMKLCEKSRRIGWTYASSYRRVMRAALIPKHDAWVMTRDLITAKEFINYCRQWCQALKIVAKGLEGEDVEVIGDGDIQAQVIRFPNGSRIYVLSSNPDAAAGKGGDLLLDEFALHKDQERLYVVAKPVVMWGYQLEIISTHRSQGTVFNRLIKEAKGANKPGWSLHSVTIYQAVAEGLVRKINEASAVRGGRQMTDEEFLEKEHGGCLNEQMWRQEYCCQPQDDNQALLGYQMIADCESDWATLKATEATINLLGGGQRYLGMDIGRHKDLSVIWVTETLGDTHYTRDLIELVKMPFHQQLEVLGQVMRDHQIVRACIDASGLGMMLAEEAQREHGTHRVEAVTFSGPSKDEMASRLLGAFQDRRVRVPAVPEVREDLHKIQKVVGQSGQPRYLANADEDGHADRFWALALAVRAASVPGSVVVDGMRLPMIRQGYAGLAPSRMTAEERAQREDEPVRGRQCQSW